MNTCKNCLHWTLKDEHEARYDRVIFPPDPETYEAEETEEANTKKWGHRVRYCKHPRLLFYQRPDRNAAAVCDGSNYRAELLTGEDFGCVMHESSNIDHPSRAAKSSPRSDA